MRKILPVIISVRIGCDIVPIRRIGKLKRAALLKIFHENEMGNKSAETLAGIFAAKESCRKVFNELGWHDIVVKKEKGGRPALSMSTSKIDKKTRVISSDLSISHDGGFAIAAVVFLLSKEK